MTPPTYKIPPDPPEPKSVDPDHSRDYAGPPPGWTTLQMINQLETAEHCVAALRGDVARLRQILSKILDANTVEQLQTLRSSLPTANCGEEDRLLALEAVEVMLETAPTESA